MFPLRTKHPLHPLSHLTSPNSLTPRHPAIPPPTHPTSTSSPKHTHTHTTATLPMPWFTSLNTHKPCFHFSLPLLVLVFPPSSHHKLTAPSHTLVKKHPPSQQCTVTRDETFSPQETSCSETLWLKCVFSWDMKRRAGGGF